MRRERRASRTTTPLAEKRSTSLDIVSQLDLDRVLQATLERATGLLECSANLRLYDRLNDVLVPLLPFRQPESIAAASFKPGPAAVMGNSSAPPAWRAS